ncbi:c-type cytochrome [Ramlibacter henchirensis]|uniref:C-type cytochrome n=1 Tax=Ramlibacter henchirensis TaxID=204072 RepID=A0A4Z0CAQ2_9BURK|nr:c-type cytochrome [Ramlibacter henchirensis]TFZ07149.1 c-type cytochrome [Ramlibacter henchirensis]
MRRSDLLSRRIGRLIVLLLAFAAAACSERPQRPRVAGGEPDRGRAAIERYGCAACHTIPGLPSYGANVGPPLLHLAERGYLAGVLPNTPEHLVQWLRDPPSIAPRTAMPNLGVSQAEAADIAAYLYAH